MIKIKVAKTFGGRLIGLMGKKKLLRDRALLITNCRQIHTWFMRFPIDAAFTNEVDEIIEIQENITPWKISKRVTRAKACLEVAAGVLQKNNLKVGDSIKQFIY